MKNFTARFTNEEKLFFVSFKENKVTLRKSEANNSYLNTKANIYNISCFNQVAIIFNLKKKIDSLFNTNLANIVNNVNFLELEYALVEKFLLKPRHETTVIYMTDDSVEKQKFVDFMTEKKVLDATNAWLNHKSEERKKHKKIMLAKVQVALEPVPIYK